MKKFFCLPPYSLWPQLVPMHKRSPSCSVTCLTGSREAPDKANQNDYQPVGKIFCLKISNGTALITWC